MGDDKEQDATEELDDQKTDQADNSDNKKSGAIDEARPGGDVIIIK